MSCCDQCNTDTGHHAPGCTDFDCEAFLLAEFSLLKADLFKGAYFIRERTGDPSLWDRYDQLLQWKHPDMRKILWTDPEIGVYINALEDDLRQEYGKAHISWMDGQAWQYKVMNYMIILNITIYPVGFNENTKLAVSYHIQKPFLTGRQYPLFRSTVMKEISNIYEKAKNEQSG